MKNVSTAILGFLAGAALMGSFAGREHAAVAASSQFQATYTYRLVQVTTSSLSDQQNLINSWAANGWEVTTVDNRMVYFRKQIR
ncbi:MAG: hypothetical protein WCL39_00245 [Armatimonadota bacterium]|jgi:hypothetical protein